MSTKSNRAIESREPNQAARPETIAAATCPAKISRLTAAALIPLAALALQWYFWEAIQPYVWFLFYPAVFFSSWVGGLRGGLVATGLSTGLVWYCFIPPQFSFAVERPMSFVSIAMFAGIGVLFSALHGRLQKATRRTTEALEATRSAKNELEAQVTQRTAALSASEMEFRGMFAQAAVGMAQVGLDGRWRRANQRLCDVVGYTWEELRDKTFQDITHPDDLKTDLTLAHQLLTGERQTYTLEKRYIRKDGSCAPVNLTVSLVRGAAGEPQHFVSVIEDIADRKRAEAAMRESEEKFSKMFESSLVATSLSTAKEGRYLAVNSAFLKTFQRTRDEVVGHTVFELNTWVDLKQREALFSKLKEQGEVHNFEMELRAKSGQVISILWSGVQIVIGGEDCLLGSALDITDRKRAEEEVRRLNQTLEQRVVERTTELKSANQELESFAYAVSHDLRAPLRAMNGFSQALLEDHGAALPDPAREYLGEIILASRHMGELIDGLLRLSRSTRGEVRHDAMDLSALASRILGEIAGAEPNRRVTWAVEPGLRAEGDERMIEVVLSNLLANAWKYTAHRSDAVIEVGAQGSENPPEPRILDPADGFTVFFVRDNGAGFDMRHAEKLFQPFQRLHREDEFPGIGIGLATVQRIVHRHGGVIKVTAAPGQGATFWLSLPSSYGNRKDKA